jgi:drug/metabolite transporter (DMT)-like permease
MGYIFGLATAMFFAGGSILVRVGHRHREADDGVFTTVLVNVLALGIMASFVGSPLWNTSGIVALMLGGVIGTVGGRTLILRAVRLIGPSRANAFMTGTPVVAAIAGWIILGESLTTVEAFGGLIVILGLLLLVLTRSSAGGRQAGVTPLSHYMIATLAPTFFGLAFVVRKWGLARFDSIVFGAFIGSITAFAVIILIDLVRRQFRDRIEMNLRSIPWWYVGAGVATSLALLSQFTAFGYLPAWVVGILQATQVVWTIGFSLLFLRGDEHIDRILVGSVFLVITGVTLIAVQ